MSNGAASPAIEPVERGVHRAARVVTIALLSIGGIAGLAIVAWSLYVRSTSIHAVGRASVISGLKLAAHLNVAYLAILGAGSIAALGLAYMALQRKRWAYAVATLGSAAAIVAVRYALSIIIRLEDPRYAKKSPWVKAASLATNVATVVLACVIVVAAIAWISQRRPTRDPH